MDEQLKKKIGKRIHDLRIRRGLTQEQLSSDSVTRNMLSMIENGNAVPSLQTLIDISEKLGIEIGYFFAETSDDTSLYYRLSEIREIRKMYAAKMYAECLERCQALPVQDDETILISAECSLASAIQACRKGTLKSALSMLEKLQHYSDRSTYVGDEILQTGRYLTEMIRTVTDDRIPEILCRWEYFPASRVSAERFLYFKALYSFYNSDADACRAIVSLISNRYMTCYINGLMKEFVGDVSGAYEAYRQVQAEDTDFYTRYRNLVSLSGIAEKMKDYKAAFDYSEKRLEMLEAFGK